jgi:nicotinamidase-related amidase
MNPSPLLREQTVLVVIDVQGKLASLMHEREPLFKNIERLIKGAEVLKIPVLLTEQYPKGLGDTVPEIKSLLPHVTPLEKMTFSCAATDAFMQALQSLARQRVLVCGIETHVCVYQTVSDLLKAGYAVEVVADAVSSRTAENKRLGMERMNAKGATVTSTEMCLFELVQVAGTDEFKAISKLVK